MNEEQFRDVVAKRCDKIVSTLTAKAKEYARGEDRLHNFNRGAEISRMSRERVLHGFMLKHFISYLDILDDMDKGILHPEEMIDEKIGDIINYFILMEASIKDRHIKFIPPS